jgi:hypothetical protein
MPSIPTIEKAAPDFHTASYAEWNAFCAEHAATVRARDGLQQANAELAQKVVHLESENARLRALHADSLEAVPPGPTPTTPEAITLQTLLDRLEAQTARIDRLEARLDMRPAPKPA